MTTAISIPDDVLERAERLARRMKKAPSELVSEAISEYLARHAPVIEPDPSVLSSARRLLEPA